jgi:hypothetical protein
MLARYVGGAVGHLPGTSAVFSRSEVFPPQTTGPTNLEGIDDDDEEEDPDDDEDSDEEGDAEVDGDLGYGAL